MANLKKTKVPIMYFGSNEETQGLAYSHRRKMTPAEKILWRHLKNRNIFGVKFRRQHPISYFIADFYCHELRLVIEVDGPIHLLKERKEKDLNRTAEFDRLGIEILRFTNDEVKSKIRKVINDIRNKIKNLKIVSSY